jgi:hypothetical protein
MLLIGRAGRDLPMEELVALAGGCHLEQSADRGGKHLLPPSRFLKTYVTKPGRTGCGIPDPLDDGGVPHCRSSQWCQHFNAWRNCHPVRYFGEPAFDPFALGFGPFYSTCHSLLKTNLGLLRLFGSFRTGFFFALDDTSFLCLIWSLKLLERPFSLPSDFADLSLVLLPQTCRTRHLPHSYSDLPDLP